MGATASGKLALARFYDGTENDMTVKEAFEKAGYPVPEDMKITLYQPQNHWMIVNSNKYAGWHDGAWDSFSQTQDWLPALTHIDLS